MKTYLLISITVIILVLQISFLPALRPFGVVPNLALILVAAAALSGPVVSAMTMALVSGFVLDLTSGSDFGLKTGILAVTVIICAYLRRSGLQLGMRSKLAIVVSGVSLLTWLIVIVELIFAGGRVHILPSLVILTTTILLNIVLGILAGPLFSRLSEVDDSYGVIL